jgi:hypothetical protein
MMCSVLTVNLCVNGAEFGVHCQIAFVLELLSLVRELISIPCTVRSRAPYSAAVPHGVSSIAQKEAPCLHAHMNI